MEINILKRLSSDVLFSHTVEGNTIKLTVMEAVRLGADIRSANLRFADLRSANLSYANLSYADLRYANLRFANLRSANLIYANLSYADLRYADLSSANLSFANLRFADLRFADLRYADLRYADLRSADLSFAAFGVKDITPAIDDIDRVVYAAASKAGALDMCNWHTCDTTHCRAGWVTTLAGEAGKALEERVGTPLAAYLIYEKSGSPIDIKRFYDAESEALEDMRKRANS